MWHALTTCLMGLLAAAQGNIIVYTQDPPHTIVEEFRDMPASFGPDIPIEGLRGFLVPGIPSDGCTTLAKPPVVDNITGKWVVIVARYNCSFETKIRNAQAAGYDCAIVHNVNSSELETMSAKDPDGIDIPSVFVNELSGLILAEKYIFTEGFYIMVNGDLPFNISTHLLLPFAIVVVLCLIAILIFMIVKCIKDRRRARRHRLPNRALKKIPTCKFSKGDPYDTCAICLDDYQEGERLRVLPCAHAYHAKCIDPWLTQSRRVCPVCKRRVLAAGERRARSDSDSDTEPLVTSAPADTQGGTFEEQRENPFVRAARYVARLRGRGAAHAEMAEEDTIQPNDENAEGEAGAEGAEGAAGEAERAPLVRVVSERRARRGRRQRRARSAPRVRPALPSVNSDEPGHIGVAALPAPRPATTPNLMNL